MESKNIPGFRTVPQKGVIYVTHEAALQDYSMSFFRECLKEKVIVVPGVFFDVNPGNRRSLMRFKNYCRISFGPEIEKLKLGLSAMGRVIAKFK